jgi:hypothetical protein
MDEAAAILCRIAEVGRLLIRLGFGCTGPGMVLSGTTTAARCPERGRPRQPSRRSAILDVATRTRERAKMSDTKPRPGDGRIMTGVQYMGATGYGAFVQFVIGFESDAAEPFRCRFENMPNLMQGLQSAAAITEQARAGQPASLDLVAPHRVTNVRVGQAPDGTIGVQFSTERGIPVLVAMPRDQATKLSTLLVAELRKKPPKLS